MISTTEFFVIRVGHAAANAGLTVGPDTKPQDTSPRQEHAEGLDVQDTAATMTTAMTTTTVTATTTTTTTMTVVTATTTTTAWNPTPAPGPQR